MGVLFFFSLVPYICTKEEAKMQMSYRSIHIYCQKNAHSWTVLSSPQKRHTSVLTLPLKISQPNTMCGVLLILVQLVLGVNLTTDYVHEFLSRLQILNFRLNLWSFLLFTKHQSNYRKAICFGCVSRDNKLYSGQFSLWWKRGHFFITVY